MRNNIALLILLSSTPALAQTTVPPPSVGTAKATPGQVANPLDRVVCRSEDTVGSRLKRHKVCATVREWQEQAAENRVATEGMQGVGTGCPEGSSAPGC